MRWFSPSHSDDGDDDGPGIGPQAQCFAYADQHDHDAFIKWNTYEFASFPEWTEAFFWYLESVRPDWVQPTRLPELLCLARIDKPQVFYMDIEWYTETPYTMDVAEALHLVRTCINVLTSYWDCNHEHPTHTPDVDDDDDSIATEECDYETFLTQCSRMTRDPWNAVSESGGYKHSYHVCVRCTNNCYFADFASLQSFAKQFIAHVERLRERYPQLWYGQGQGDCIIDRNVYTANRAMRLPLCVKKTGDITMFRPCSLTSHDMPYLRADLLKYVHAYVPPGGRPFIIGWDGHGVVPRGLSSTPHVNQPRLPHAKHDPTPVSALRRVYTKLGYTDLQVARDGTVCAFHLTEDMLEDTVRYSQYTPQVVANWSQYAAWTKMARMLWTTFADKTRARTLWLFFTEQVPRSRDNAEAQWQRYSQWLERQEQSAGHVFQYSQKELVDTLTRLYILDAAPQACPRDVPTVCYVSREPVDADDLCRARLQTRIYDDALVVRCSTHNVTRFYGYVSEGAADTFLFDERYVSMHIPLVTDLSQRLLRRHRRTVVIAAQMGTGKTALLSTLKSITRPAMSVLILGVRVLLTHDLHARLSRGTSPILPQLVHYQTTGHQQLADHAQVVVQADSLLRLVQRDGSFRRYDVVVLEEIESLLSHLSSSTLCDKRRLIGDALLALANTASLVLVLDADIGERGYEFLRMTRADTDTNIYRNLATPLARKHLWIPVLRSWLARILYSVHKGEPCYVVSNSKRAIDVVEKLIHSFKPEARVRTYTSETDNCIKRAVSECNEDWTTYDVVMWSPVISAGVNFDPPVPHFYRGFVYATDRSACARDICQQAGRVRRVISNEIYVYFKTSNRKANLRPYLQMDTIEEAARVDYSDILMMHPELASVGHLDPNALRMSLDTEHPLTRLLLHNALERSRSAADFRAEYGRYCLLHGDTLEVDRVGRPEDPFTPAETALFHVVAKEVAAKHLTKLAGAARPHDLADYIGDVQQGRSVDPLSLLKDVYCRALRVGNITDRELLELMNKPDFMERMITLISLLEQSASELMATISWELTKLPDTGQRPGISADMNYFVSRLYLAQNTSIDLPPLASRVALATTLCFALGFTAPLDADAIHPPMLDYAYRDWLAGLGESEARVLRATMPNIDWDNEPKHALPRINTILRSLAGITLKRAGARLRIHTEHLLFNAQLCIAVLLIPSDCRDLFTRFQIAPRFLAHEIDQAINAARI